MIGKLKLLLKSLYVWVKLGQYVRFKECVKQTMLDYRFQHFLKWDVPELRILKMSKIPWRVHWQRKNKCSKFSPGLYYYSLSNYYSYITDFVTFVFGKYTKEILKWKHVFRGVAKATRSSATENQNQLFINSQQTWMLWTL